MTDTIIELNKLRWQCRRGMLELDLFLKPFLEEVYSVLSSDDQTIFVRLLTATDQDLFIWLMGDQQVEDLELARLVKMIQQHAKTAD